MKLIDTNSDDVKVKGWEVYSTTETPIGTWIDGKTIYRVVLQATLGAAGSWANLVDISKYSMDKLINLYGYTDVGTSVYSKRVPMYETSGYYITVARYGNYIKYMSQGHSGYKIRLIIEYTKTS